MQCKQDAAAIKKNVMESAKTLGVDLKDMQMKAVLFFVGGRDTLAMENLSFMVFSHVYAIISEVSIF